MPDTPAKVQRKKVTTNGPAGALQREQKKGLANQCELSDETPSGGK